VVVRPAGDRAFVAGGSSWPAVALAGELRRLAAEQGIELQDLVPGAETVLAVATTPAGMAALAASVASLPPAPSPGDGGCVGDRRSPATEPAGTVEIEAVEIEVVYDGADLDAVAGAAGMTTAEVVDAHRSGRYTAAFCGFVPGFAYLSGLPERLRLPRRTSPRTGVPAGSVAIADRYSAVYPVASPGGWHLLGRTDARLWDPLRKPPALLRPGTPVRFVALARPRPRPSTGRESAGGAGGAGAGGPDRIVAAFEVLDAGMLTTVQDAGRPGLADQGVPTSGWLDGPAAALANRLVGNEVGAAVLEATIRGPSLRLVGPAGTTRAIAVTGAPVAITVDGRAVAPAAPFEMAAGGELDVGTVSAGARIYVAVSGGIAVDPVLGSRATDLLSGLGPLPLVVGQQVPVGPDHGRRVPIDVAPVAVRPERPVLRIRVGPRADWLAPAALDALTTAVWTVGGASNRIGLRLSGPVLQRARTGELLSEGIAAGALQIPPSGQPVLFLADHPVTGGYPVLAVVVDEDLHLAAQLAPGATLRFRIASRRT
jgi:biotin-dependent carboxylase-like uncharacterized protein